MSAETWRRYLRKRIFRRARVIERKISQRELYRAIQEVRRY